MAAQVIGTTETGHNIWGGTADDRTALGVKPALTQFQEIGGDLYESNGSAWKQIRSGGAAHVTDGALATIIVVSGGYTYIAEAIPGASDTAAVWRCSKVSSTGTTTWADGNGNFDNTPGAAGVSLSGLTYS